MYKELVVAAHSNKAAIAARAESLLMRDAACVPRYYDEVIRVFPQGVEGLKTNALNALLLNEVILPRQ